MTNVTSLEPDQTAHTYNLIRVHTGHLQVI